VSHEVWPQYLHVLHPFFRLSFHPLLSFKDAFMEELTSYCKGKPHCRGWYCCHLHCYGCGGFSSNSSWFPRHSSLLLWCLDVVYCFLIFSSSEWFASGFIQYHVINLYTICNGIDFLMIWWNHVETQQINKLLCFYVPQTNINGLCVQWLLSSCRSVYSIIFFYFL